MLNASAYLRGAVGICATHGSGIFVSADWLVTGRADRGHIKLALASVTQLGMRAKHLGDNISRFANCYRVAELYAAFKAKGTGIPVVLENRLGDGCAILTTHERYPGNPAVYPIYRDLVKRLLTASHENADVKVTGSDKVRFSLFYDEDGREVLYLLNTEYSTDSCVKVIRDGRVTDVRLAPMELKTLEL